MAYTQEQNQSIELVSEEAQTLDLLEKFFKSDSFNMSTQLKETMSKEIKESMRMMSH